MCSLTLGGTVDVWGRRPGNLPSWLGKFHRWKGEGLEEHWPLCSLLGGCNPLAVTFWCPLGWADRPGARAEPGRRQGGAEWCEAEVSRLHCRLFSLGKSEEENKIEGKQGTALFIVSLKNSCVGSEDAVSDVGGRRLSNIYLLHSDSSVLSIKIVYMPLPGQITAT